MNGDYMIDQVPIFGKFLPPSLAFINAQQTWLPADQCEFSIPLMWPVGALLDLLIISSSLSTHLASSLLCVMHFLVRAAKTCSCVNNSTMIMLIVISFMRSVPSLMFIIQPLLESSMVITVLLYLLLVKLCLAPKELSVFFSQILRYYQILTAIL